MLLEKARYAAFCRDVQRIIQISQDIAVADEKYSNHKILLFSSRYRSLSRHSSNSHLCQHSGYFPHCFAQMPCNAVFCVVLSVFPGIVIFLLMTTLFAKYFKMVQFNAMCSSQIVVSLGGSDY